MHIKITTEALLKQLGITEIENALTQGEKIIKNTKGIETIFKHIISLNDYLKHVSGFVTLSSKKDFLKIKCDESVTSKEIIEEFHQKVVSWGEKHKIKLEKLSGKEVYYILGID